MRTLAALLFISTSAFAQPDCSVSGLVVNSVTHTPVIRAHLAVEVTNTDTDQNGEWRAEHVTCGKVTITATRPGFLRLERRIDTPATDLKIELIPQAVVTGRVMDELGDPIIDSHVSLIEFRIVQGLRDATVRSSGNTNDLGEFRFSGLPKGRYIVCANVVGEGTRRYGEKCAPGPPDAGETAAAEIAAGEERRIDFVLPPVSTVTVSGRVTGLPGRTYFTLRMAPQSQVSGMGNVFSARARADSTFSFRGVPAGAYTLTLEADGPEAHIPVNVGNNDISDLQLRIEPFVTVVAKINVESVAGRSIEKLDGIVRLWAGPQGYSSRPNENRELRIEDVAPGSYHVGFSPPLPFYIRSVTLEGRNIRGEMLAVQPGMGKLEVTLRDDGGAVEGDVSADDQSTAAWVFLQKDGAPIANVDADSKGHFRVDNLPPGDYRVYAWNDNANVEYRNPEWMQRYGKPVTVTIAPGQSAHVKLVTQLAPE